MPTFAIYKIMFSPARQRSLLAEDGRTNLDHAQEYMEEVLDEKLHICKELRDKTLLSLDNYVETRRERDPDGGVQREVPQVPREAGRPRAGAPSRLPRHH